MNTFRNLNTAETEPCSFEREKEKEKKGLIWNQTCLYADRFQNVNFRFDVWGNTIYSPLAASGPVPLFEYCLIDSSVELT